MSILDRLEIKPINIKRNSHDRKIETISPYMLILLHTGIFTVSNYTYTHIHICISLNDRNNQWLAKRQRNICLLDNLPGEIFFP